MRDDFVFLDMVAEFAGDLVRAVAIAVFCAAVFLNAAIFAGLLQW